MKKKGMYSYVTTDGRIALSPNPLYLELDQHGKLDLNNVGTDEMKNLSIMADPLLAHLLCIAADGDAWISPEKIMAMSARERIDGHISADRNCCLLQGGTIYLYHDNGYAPLASIISDATRDELVGYLWNVALQAALAQIERSHPDKDIPA